MDPIKVCLINPPFLFPREAIKVDYNGELFQPLGLAYIAAVLEKKGYEVEIIDALAEDFSRKPYDGRFLVGLSYEAIGEIIREKRPDIVGISVPFTAHSPSAMEVARLVKGIDMDIVVVLGGPHVSVVPEKCLNDSVDYLVLGEGEETFPELVKYIEEGKPRKSFKEIKGIAFMLGDEMIKTPPRPAIQDLDAIPFPARHLLPLEKYFDAQKKSRYSRGVTKRTATVMTSRGCPFGCIFCSIDLTMGKKFRARSAGNVVDEIEHLVKDYSIESIEFEDDNLTFDRKRVHEIFDEVLRRKLKFEWRTPNGVRADLLDAELLRKFKATGCYELWFAPESGSQRVIDKVIGKHLPLEKVEFAVKESVKAGIKPKCFFVIGLPGETKEEIRETLSFMRKLKKLGAGVFINIATPLYGTRMYDLARENKYLRDVGDENLLYNNGLYMDTPEFTAEEVRELFLEGRRIQKGEKAKFSLIASALTNPNKAARYASRRIRSLIGSLL